MLLRIRGGRASLLCRVVPQHSLPSRAHGFAAAANHTRWASGGKHPSKKAKYEALPAGWEAIIGVEVHAQLRSSRKLFSPAPLEQFSSEARDNQLVAPFDAALPGSLPSLQEEPLALALRTCLALECNIASEMTFDRKHYFYADLTSGYQISQKYAPIATNGVVRLLQDDGFLSAKENEAQVRIEQIQLEQDTAKSTHSVTHDSSSTLIDLNRAGSALIEIVSGPDMRSAEQAGAYIRKLREILRKTEVSDGNMDQGSLRCDVNVSVHREGEPWGVRCEVKNLNSIRFVMNAIDFEVQRQHSLLTSGEQIIQETRAYDEASATTYSLRSKEDSPDYRYMPDPNLPPVQVTTEMIDAVRLAMPELMEQQRERLIREYQLPVREVNILIRIGLEEEKDRVDAIAYFEQLAVGRDPKTALNWIIQVLLRALNKQEKTFAENIIDTACLGQIIDLVQSAKVTSSTARSLVEELLQDHTILQPHSASPNAILDLLASRDALVLDSTGDLVQLCQEVIEQLHVESEKVRRGNQKVMMRLIGEVMKRSKGRADAQRAREELTSLLTKKTEHV